MYSYEKTNYPEIFKKVYWGTGKFEEYEQEIITNRNKFVEEFKIKKRYNNCNLMLFKLNTDFFDHIEIYETIDNKYVFLISPYIEYNGNMDKIYKLYHTKAHTYIKQFNTVNEMKNFIKDKEFNGKITK